MKHVFLYFHIFAFSVQMYVYYLSSLIVRSIVNVYLRAPAGVACVIDSIFNVLLRPHRYTY